MIKLSFSLETAISFDTFSNYWMRLRRIWRILQNKKGVVQLGLWPLWITPSEICRILHIQRKSNSIIAFIIHSKYFLVLKGTSPFCSVFPLTKYNTTLFLVNGSIICSRLHFWSHRINNFWQAALLTSLVQHLVNSSWLWWIICVVLTNQKQEIFWMNNNYSSLSL